MDGDDSVETGFSLKPGEVHDPARDEAIEALARLLREGRVDTFNARVTETGPADLTGANLRMADLRMADLTGACLQGAYLRAADLRGLDLSTCDLAGASIAGAKVSGVRFPDALGPDEITMSVSLGTRLRPRRP
jgi:hypothetical protein